MASKVPARSQMDAAQHARCKDDLGAGVLESVLALVVRNQKPLPRCMKCAAWEGAYAWINQPTSGTIISVLNAIEVTLPMYG